MDYQITPRSHSSRKSAGGSSHPGSSSVSAGGFVPYSSFVRRQPVLVTSPSTYLPSLWSSSPLTGSGYGGGGSGAGMVGDISPPRWCSKHEVPIFKRPEFYRWTFRTLNSAINGFWGSKKPTFQWS